MRHVWLSELRRDGGLWIAVLLALVDIATVSSNSGYWVGDWHATSIQVQFPMLALAPLVTAAAAWTGGRDRRCRLGDLQATMPRHRAWNVACQWSALACWCVVAYLVGVGVACARTAPHAASGWLWPSYFLLGLFAVLAYSAIGVVLGALIPWRLTAPAAAIAVFGLFMVLSAMPDNVRRLSLFYGASIVAPGLRLRAVVVLALLGTAAAVVLAALGVVAVTAHGTGRHRAARGLLCLPLILAIVTVVGVAGADYTTRLPPANPICAGHEPTVCVWPEHHKWAGQAETVVRRLSAALGSVYRFPDTVYEVGLRPHKIAAPELSITTIPATPVSFVRSLTTGLVPARPTPCLEQRPGLFDRYVLLQAWLEITGAGTVGPDLAVDPAALNALIERPLREQRTFVRDTMRAVAAACGNSPAT